MTIINKHYNNIVRSDILLKNKLKNINKIPQIEKIVLNITSKSKIVEPLLALELIACQKPVINKAKKSIAAFNLRKGTYVSCKVILSKENKDIFLFKLTNYILPRVKEFKGIYTSKISNNGDYTLGIKNINVFPEIENQSELFSHIYGMDITLVTSTKNKQDTKDIFSSILLPFRK